MKYLMISKVSYLAFAVAGVLSICGVTCRASVEPELTTAIRQKNVSKVQQLLARGADVNARDEGDEQTPLMWAAQTGNPTLIALLLVHGGAVNLTDDNGNTALMLAAKQGNMPVARLLLDKGAAPNIRNAQGATALMLANASGHADVAKMLAQGETRLPREAFQPTFRATTLHFHRTRRTSD